jgi:hypothetical protein
MKEYKGSVTKILSIYTPFSSPGNKVKLIHKERSLNASFNPFMVEISD